ncbi:branched-chain amino acid ABC transporter permease [Frigidibacter albus]|uniref:Branched-chain amino acid ABC transporter permease n=1 Tax=Frigidibacter albus TaxID=1465486 RepID=A0A6L8VJ03_9RHOB|nr:branched-chain amino acid ABC transporter permease [Frigidibacter albus]MZQ89289.1 branched-chain amino acid ABC transporter permease [Frigidibacter albus]NBE31195.1 branched-chain amino acid ABC transporter permease [Frigidibacter albus]GGH53420.1 branched-chain amino acid ABC transporter permease [Frigidibacter albus]
MSDFLIHVISVSCIYGILALSLNLQAGFTGLMNFGLIAMFGCGVYGAGLVHRFGLPVALGPALALILAVLMGLFLARLGRRLSTDYWGIATLSIAEIARIFATNLEPLTGGAQGISGLPLLFSGLRPWDGAARLALFAVILGVAWLICERLVRSNFGLGMKLIREEPQLARALGYDIDRIRSTVMVIASVIAAVAGVLYAHYLSFVGPELLLAPETFLIWAMVIIGGIANNRGVIAGAFAMQFMMAYVPFVKDYFALPSDFVAAARLMLSGGVILGFLLLRPQGIFPERVGGRHDH